MKKQKINQKELTSVSSGDIVNLHELLFTKNRDYLIKFNGDQVKAEQFADKVIVIYFVLLPLVDNNSAERVGLITERLKDVYNFLPPNKGFEIVFVAVDDDDTSFEEEMLFDPLPKTDLENDFEEVFSCMPWTAIPLSDRTSRELLQKRFGFRDNNGSLFVIDSKGVVLQTIVIYDFIRYGSLGYPFSSERLESLESECKAIAAEPTVEKLLSSPERDYVIANNGDKVPIHTLEDKVVALYFHAGNVTETDMLTEELRNVYENLAEKEVKFEVVLLYLCDTPITIGFRNEDSFWRTFGTMPWLALPYKDPILKKLKIIYEYPEDYNYGDDEEISKLVIVGPHGEFCEPCGADILLNYRVPGYPFTREKALELETERIKKLKLEMILETNKVLTRNDGSKVSLSQLAGKRIMLLFGLFEDEFLNMLKERYLCMKSTDGEFEVIHIYVSDTDDVEGLPAWFVYHLPKGFRYASDIIPADFDKRYFRQEEIYDVGDTRRLLAFDRDGMIVRDSAFPTIEDMNFPFYTSGLEKEALLELDSVFHWYEWEDTESWNREAGYIGPNQSCG
nr:PREDICTED: probable nucleoredoxin 1 isoform X2 [Daucus carota subsp. sativus]